MKKYSILLIVFLLPMLSLASDKLAIDLKVPLAETANLTPAQVGATIYLMQSDWARVTEIGEDVAVWLTNYERKKNILGQQVISVTLEVRDPSTLRTGNLIQREKITVRYWMTDIDKGEYDQEILKKLDSLSHELKVEAYHLGIKIESSLESILK